MASRLLAVTFEVPDPSRAAAFWAGLLGRDVVDHAGAEFVPGNDTQVGLRFVAGRPATGANRMHLHVTCDGSDDQPATVAAALRLGATHLDVGQLPDEPHVVLADPEGDEFCVIPRGNAFLAGCGQLGEVACEGTREVGLFWSEALGWPLVWDQDQETAVQSPLGGTKVAWGGPPVAPITARNRQRFDLVSADPGPEADRLVALGATRLGVGDDGALALADPDGNEFALRAG
ncbi:VOC family protein [Nocardioides sp. SYSU D00038]|uniref:VOC family protein n=1 Tax=Nocardioides sp. SYSU D00038 TaxID=2812554 RepID=UPI0019672CCC|nr:VOC family protein [Nocardioides sp. SYSU D00038]